MKYRQIVPVDARQIPPLTPGWHEFPPMSLDALAGWCGGQVLDSLAVGPYILVPRFEGDLRAWPGQWIVRDVRGGFHKVEHEDFASNFEPAEESGS